MIHVPHTIAMKNDRVGANDEHLLEYIFKRDIKFELRLVEIKWTKMIEISLKFFFHIGCDTL